MKIIGIIPCKKHSERLPHKNTLILGDKMLFEWSIEYAISEGIIPVVSTDDEFVINWCIENHIDYYKETVNESNMCNCIDQVLSQYDCDYFCLLQPTSPLRKSGMLQEMILQNYSSSIYTAEKIKIIGHIGNEFITAYRDQDTSTKFLYHHDGNMILVNYKWYKQSHKLFDDTSQYILNDKPYSLQIDYKEDFEIITKLI